MFDFNIILDLAEREWWLLSLLIVGVSLSIYGKLYRDTKSSTLAIVFALIIFTLTSAMVLSTFDVGQIRVFSLLPYVVGAVTVGVVFAVARTYLGFEGKKE